MSSNVVDFSAYRRTRRGRPHRTVWVPEVDYNRDLNNLKFTPYWTGREVLCFLIANPNYKRPLPSLYSGPPENPFNYVEVKGPGGRSIYRPAAPPDCEVDDYDWEEFEREACRS